MHQSYIYKQHFSLTVKKLKSRHNKKPIQSHELLNSKRSMLIQFENSKKKFSVLITSDILTCIVLFHILSLKYFEISTVPRSNKPVLCRINLSKRRNDRKEGNQTYRREIKYTGHNSICIRNDA